MGALAVQKETNVKAKERATKRDDRRAIADVGSRTNVDGPHLQARVIVNAYVAHLGVAAEVDLDSWPVPPLFRLVRELTPQMSTAELYRTLNMGIGMVVVCAPDDLDTIVGSIDEPTWVLGRLVAGPDLSVTLPTSARPAE